MSPSGFDLDSGSNHIGEKTLYTSANPQANPHPVDFVWVRIATRPPLWLLPLGSRTQTTPLWLLLWGRTTLCIRFPTVSSRTYLLGVFFPFFLPCEWRQPSSLLGELGRGSLLFLRLERDLERNRYPEKKDCIFSILSRSSHPQAILVTCLEKKNSTQ